MGKKKQPNKNDPEALKEAGNKAFQAKMYLEAIDLYSQAIELALQLEKPSPIYFANRANAHLELSQFEECILDCNKAIEIDSAYTKSHYRKAKALLFIDKILEAEQALAPALIQEPTNSDILSLQEKIIEEKQLENKLPPEHPERRRFDNLLVWMKENGSQFDKLKLRYYSTNYRGVHALQDIKIGEQILFVPRNLLITLEMAYKTPIGKLMYEKGLRHRLISPKHNFLGSAVLQERRKPKSEFQIYLDILPKDVTEFPVFFTDEEKAWLEGSKFLGQIEEKIVEIKKDYDLVCLEVPEFAQFSLREYTEIRMIVASRIFGITIDGIKTDAFVPYADMLNHKRPRETTWFYSDEKEGFVIEACEDLPRGAPIHDSYGKKCNSRFFLNYGFINANNDANEVAFKIFLDPQQKNFQQKTSLINQRLYQSFRVVENLIEPVMIEFISWCRYVVFEDDMKVVILARDQAIADAKKKREKHGEDSDDDDAQASVTDAFKGFIPSFSIQNETKAWELIRQLADEAYSQYPQGLQEDYQILNKDDLTQNQRNCVLFRSGEKEVLVFLIATATLMIELLTLSQKDAKAKILKFRWFNLIDNYVKDNVFKLIQ